MGLLKGRLKDILGEQVKQLYIYDLDWDEEVADLVKNNEEIKIIDEI